MRQNEQLPKIENTRGKFTRLEDKAFFQGWVVGERESNFIVTLEGSRPVAAGDTFLCEIFLHGWTLKALSLATHVSVREGEGGESLTVVAMNQVQTINVQHGSGNERFRVTDLSAKLWTIPGGTPAACPILDVSDMGLGVALPSEPAQGTKVGVAVEFGREPIEFDCEVRYVRPMGKEFRVGLQIVEIDRLAHRKWRKFIAENNARMTDWAA